MKRVKRFLIAAQPGMRPVGWQVVLLAAAILLSFFRVTPAAANSYLTSPKGGESWTAESTHNIRWNSNGDPGFGVSLDYSTDSGVHWVSIVQNSDNRPGQYAWCVPDIPTHQAKIRLTISLYNGMGYIPTIIEESNDFTILPPLATVVPKSPTNLTSSTDPANRAINLAWQDNSDNEYGFKIEKSTTSGSGYVEMFRVPANTTSLSDTGLSPGTYFYRVRAYDVYNSDYSNEACATLPVYINPIQISPVHINPVLLVPAAPTGLTATAVSSSEIDLSWTGSSGADKYTVYRDVGAIGNFLQISTQDAGTTTYKDTGLSPHMHYAYDVKASNFVGDSSLSEPAYATTPNSVQTTTTSPPTVTHLDPGSGPEVGGTRVTVTGSGFTGATAVKFGSVAGSGLDVSGDTLLTVTPPPGTGAVDVTVTGPGGTSTVNQRDQFTYTPSTMPPASQQTTQPASGKTVIRFYIGSSDYYVNDQVQSMDTTPIISGARTLLPIRYVATPLRASVDWNQDEQKVTVTLNGKTIELWIDQPTAKVNGVVVPVDPNNPNVTPIVVPPGRTMLPLRFIAENLGCQVDWDRSQQMVTVTYPKP